MNRDANLEGATSVLLMALLTVSLGASTAQAQGTRDVYRTPDDKTQNSYRVHEPAGTPVGLVALLPMFGGALDSFATASLISAGGTGAVRFAQYCAQTGCHPAARPVAVFSVDAALDFERWWRSQELALQRASPKAFPQESEAVLRVLRRNLGGSPAEKPEVYLRQSPFLASAPEGGNARLLKNVAIRLYTEPDIGWRIENWGADYYTSNVIDQAALILQLQILGNNQAELITTSGKGYRPDGERNPHSWSIVDEPDLADWIARLFKL